MDNIQINENQYSLEITVRWFKWAAIFLVFFCIAWDSFLFFWYANTGMPFIFYLFPIVHVAVGVGLTYYTIALFINKTHLSIDPTQIRIQHSPLPWIGGKTIDATEITQLYVREQTRHNKGSVSYSYELRAKLKNGRSTVLVGSTILSNPDDAQFLEEKIEHFLKIKDEPVKGEYS